MSWPQMNTMPWCVLLLLLGGTGLLAQPMGSICYDTCATSIDGSCDDGGSGSEAVDYCLFGTDCTDCGQRFGELTESRVTPYFDLQFQATGDTRVGRLELQKGGLDCRALQDGALPGQNCERLAQDVAMTLGFSVVNENVSWHVSTRPDQVGQHTRLSKCFAGRPVDGLPNRSTCVVEANGTMDMIDGDTAARGTVLKVEAPNGLIQPSSSLTSKQVDIRLNADARNVRETIHPYLLKLRARANAVGQALNSTFEVNIYVAVSALAIGQTSTFITPSYVSCTNTDVVVTTATWASEISVEIDGNIIWAVGTLRDYSQYTQNICLSAGSTLTLIDSYGDGWHGGYVMIGGIPYGLISGFSMQFSIGGGSSGMPSPPPPPPPPPPPSATMPPPLTAPTTAPPSTTPSACLPMCFGRSCDGWWVNGYSCSDLTSQYGCDCTGCTCPPLPSPPPPPLRLCDNTCQYPFDYTVCDDGGPGADFALCALGTDCNDCGPRTYTGRRLQTELSMDTAEYSPALSVVPSPVAASRQRRRASAAHAESALHGLTGAQGNSFKVDEEVEFYFQARDADGLPVMTSTFLNRPRVDSFQAELITEYIPGQPHVWHDKDKREQSRVYGTTFTPQISYVGERDGRDGVFKVTVTAHRVGLHRVQLYGPPSNITDHDTQTNMLRGTLERMTPYGWAGLDPFMWSVSFIVTCDEGEAQVPASFGPNGSATCMCSAGYQLGDSGCEMCTVGYVKSRISQRPNEQCERCPGAASDDVRRRISGEGTADWHGCSCEEGLFLSTSIFTSEYLVSACPDSTHIDAWRLALGTRVPFIQDIHNRAALKCLCVSGIGNARQINSDICDWRCMAKECRSIMLDTLAEKRQSFEPNEERCTMCQKSEEFTAEELCPASTRVETIQPRAGFWRKTPLSARILKCPRPANCNNTSPEVAAQINEGRYVQDAWCAPGATGVFCSVCQTAWDAPPGGVGFYQLKDGSCEPCDEVSTRFVLYALPFAIGLFLVVAITCICTGWWIYRSNTDDKLKQLFHSIDEDGGGTLSFKELVKAKVAWKKEKHFQWYRNRSKSEQKTDEDVELEAKVKEELKNELAGMDKFKRIAMFGGKREGGALEKVEVTYTEFEELMRPKRREKTKDKKGGRQSRASSMGSMSSMGSSMASLKLGTASSDLGLTNKTQDGWCTRSLNSCCGYLAKKVRRIAQKIVNVVRKGNVVIPKLKILIAMFQVQSGIVPTFQITLPEQFLQMLRDFSFWDFNVPLDCVIRINFWQRLLYRTLWPLALSGIFFFTAYWLRRTLRQKFKKQEKEEKETQVTTIKEIKLQVQLPDEADEAADQNEADGSRGSPSENQDRETPVKATCIQPRCMTQSLLMCSMLMCPWPHGVYGVWLTWSQLSRGDEAASDDAEAVSPSRSDEESARRVARLMGLYNEPLAMGRQLSRFHPSKKPDDAKALYKYRIQLLRCSALSAGWSAVIILLFSFTSNGLWGAGYFIKPFVNGSGCSNAGTDCDSAVVMPPSAPPAMPGDLSVLSQEDLLTAALSLYFLLLFLFSLIHFACMIWAAAIVSRLERQSILMRRTSIDSVIKELDEHHSTINKGARTHWRAELSSYCTETAMMIFFLVYPSVSAMLFATFSCEGFDDGTSYLRADYSLNCDALLKIRWYARIMLFVYPLGLPLLYAGVIYFHTRQVSEHLLIRVHLRLLLCVIAFGVCNVCSSRRCRWSSQC